MKNLIQAFRSLLFYIGYVLLTVWIGGTGFLLGWLPYRKRIGYLLLWNRCTIAWLRITCGLGYEIIGAENLPPVPYVALSKHTSQWETYFLQTYLRPVSIVLKKELLRVPFFGWGLALARPIAIDRNNPKQAIKQTLAQGKTNLSENISLLIFPEGTRKHAGRETNYARGGASVAVAAGVPVVPIAHNASEFWPADKFIKYPGKVTVKIGVPIDSTKYDSREITEMVKQWIEAEVAALPKRA